MSELSACLTDTEEKKRKKRLLLGLRRLRKEHLREVLILEEALIYVQSREMSSEKHSVDKADRMSRR